MNSYLISGITLLILSAIGFAWSQLQVFLNCQKDERYLFTYKWLFTPEIFNEKGNRYRKIFIALYVPAFIGMGLIFMGTQNN